MLYRPLPMSVYVRLRQHISIRLSEWTVGVQTLTFGAVLLLPGSLYDANPSFSFMRQVLAENVLGALMLFFGALRLVSLYINGSRQDVTPWLRAGCAGVDFMVFTLLSFSFMLSGVAGIWLAFLPSIAIVEFINVSRATHDAGAYSARVS